MPKRPRWTLGRVRTEGNEELVAKGSPQDWPSPEREDPHAQTSSNDSASAASVQDGTDVESLEKILEKIDEAIAAREASNQKDGVDGSLPSNLNSAENLLDKIASIFRCPRDKASKKKKKRKKKKKKKGIAKDVERESYRIVRDVLRGIGNVHLAAKSLSILAYVLERVDMLKANSEKCMKLLKRLRDLGKVMVALIPRLVEGDKELKRATSLIAEGAILCCSHLNYGVLKRFAFVGVKKDDFDSLEKEISSIYEHWTLKVTSSTSTMPLPLSIPDPRKDAVGMNEKVEGVLRKMQNLGGSGAEPGVQAVVLWGMGGIGKSTLGDAVVAKLYSKDLNYARVEVGERPGDGKIRDCQRDILERLSNQKKTIGDCKEGGQILRNFFSNAKECPKPVLLFIDNIFASRDLDLLLPNDLVLPDNSTLVVTSRDGSVSEIVKEKGAKSCQSYRVDGLESVPAKELLCKHAFGENTVPPGKEEAVNSALERCGGMPLALEVVGRYLRRRKIDSAWSTVIQRLEKFRAVDGRVDHEDKLNRALKFSYDSLDRDHQSAFLDISCMLRNRPWDWVECLHGEEVLATLEELALVKKEESRHYNDDATIKVHDLFVALGLNEQPEKGIVLQKKDELDDFLGDPVRYLNMCSIELSRDADLSQCESLQSLPEDLSDLSSLEFLDLSQCESLVILPKGFSGLSSLKRLYVFACESLANLPEYFCGLSSLNHLEISSCTSLASLPKGFFDLPSLDHLDLSGCQSLESLPEDFSGLVSLKHLDLSRCKSLHNLPEGFSCLSSLEYLKLSKCKSLGCLPKDFSGLSSLNHLDLSQCKRLASLPEGFSVLSSLEYLDLSQCESLVSLPKGFSCLSSLKRLYLFGCESLVSLPEDFSSLSSLEYLNLLDAKALLVFQRVFLVSLLSTI